MILRKCLTNALGALFNMTLLENKVIELLAYIIPPLFFSHLNSTNPPFLVVLID
jgi:hypothetical protein